MKQFIGINIAPSSETGHFIQEATQVVNLDEIKETFLVEGKAKMVTKNHTTLEVQNGGLVTCQVVYNPFAEMFERVRD